MLSLKNLSGLIFCFLLFEGALRKWFLTRLSQGLLIIRDPLVIWIYYLKLCKGPFSAQQQIPTKMFSVGNTGGYFFLSLNQAHPLTIAYGARTNLLHFPLLFIMGRVLNWNDVMLFGKAFLILSAPMTWVVAQQFQADAEDIINTAAGGTGSQLETSGGKVRASGTFTFVSGIVFYYCFTVSL